MILPHRSPGSHGPRRRRGMLPGAAVAGALALVLTSCSSIGELGGFDADGSDENPFAGATSVPEGPAAVAAAGVVADLDELAAEGVSPREVGIATAELVDPAWLASATEATGVPERALAAYAGAEILLASLEPGCRMGWATLAGIGWVESRHGTIFGGEILADGQTSEPIFGVTLDGTRFDAIPDRDGGAIDGDPEFDRAVGPMQFIPSTWMAWGASAKGADADGDVPAASPHDIDDASLSAARYLCDSGDDVATEDGWRAAIAEYNPAPSYLRSVAEEGSSYLAAVG